MQDILGSVRRSLVFRTPPDNEEGASTLVDKMNSFIRKSRVFSKPSSPTLLPPAHREDPSPPPPADDAPPIRWRKGELIGCGAFGRVYMGMNLDSGELLAVKQVMIAAHSASNEKAQAHIRELEEEVNLLKNLSHPNIVRYLGTVREEESLNILLEFVPGGSISSLLGKFGPFPEPVMKTYTKQLLLGLEYLHKHGIMHRDIKGANILVDNKGCIKLADFGASKQVVELATVTGAKSLKGTPYWMAPEVVHQTGHNISADIWSVGCTVIEMATGKPPWSDQYQGVAVLFHIGNSDSLPPIPEHMSVAAKDFLLKCLQREPNMRPSACELLQHPFVTGERAKPHPALQTSFMGNPETPSPSNAANLRSIQMTSCNDSADLCNLGSLSCSTVFPVKLSESKHVWGANDVDGEMCQIDDNDDFMVSDVKLDSVVRDDFNKSFNPMCEPFDDWECSPNGDLEPEHRGMDLDTDQAAPVPTVCSSAFEDGDSDFSFSCGPSISEDDDELTESKITAFLDEKALELKKLQTPLYEEFYNSLNTICSPAHEETTSNFLKLPPKSRSPSRGPMGTSPSAVDQFGTASPGSNNRRVSNVGSPSNQMSQDTPSPLQHNDRKGAVGDAQQESSSTSVSFSEIQRKWKEELDQELERKREMMRQAGVGGKTSSPKDRPPNRPKTRFASPGK